MIDKEKFIQIFQDKAQDFLNKQEYDLVNHVGFEGKGTKIVKTCSAELLKEFSDSVLLPALEAIIDSINKKEV